MTARRTPEQLRAMGAKLRAEADLARKRLPRKSDEETRAIKSRIYRLEQSAQHYDAAADRAQERVG